ncbi:MAG: polysaccharide pyruvyl transferase family protein [Clostridium sp.]
MKIGIMTWLYNNNYGTVLQAYALQKKLRLKGYDCTLINYRANTKAKIKNFIISKNSYKLIFEKIEAYFAKKNNPKKLEERFRKFNDFLIENCNLSKLYTSPKNLNELNDIFDIFICGSDQIWSPNLFNNIYYFSYVNNEKKKISYAPSFGVSSIENKKKSARIKELLERYDKISVREEQGANIIEELIGKNVSVVLDPTLLLSEKEWSDLLIKPNEKEKYILCYFLGDKEIYWKKVDEIRRLTGYKVIVIPVHENSYRKDYELSISAGPREFLGLIKNAELVCTDSFHGSIFSINFRKDFFVFKRFSDDKVISQNSRIYNILNMLGLNDRLINENKRLSYNNIVISNYDEVHEKLNIEKNKSISWLIEAIEK